MKADRPSLTAIKIARGIVFVSEDPRVREILPAGAVELNAAILREAGLLTPGMERLSTSAERSLPERTRASCA